MSTGSLLAQARPVRVRKSVGALNDQSPDIVSLKEAVKKMKALDPADQRHWRKQAEIHGAILGSFGSCRHGSWYFLPWHRAYLFAFEEIVRELSGNEDFALPYWDWSTQHTLPAPFWGDGNPLSNPARGAEPGSGRRPTLTPTTTFTQQELDRFVSQTVVSQILGLPDFVTFAGAAVDNLDDEGGADGRLEGAPHNFIHRWVGGDMGSGGSPYDAIFWLHHCNVDRLWSEWTRRHPNDTPSDAGWVDTVFSGKYRFYDRKGAPLETLTVRQTLDIAGLGYRYEQRPVPPAPRLRAARPQGFVGPKSTSSTLRGGASEFLLPSTAAQAERMQRIVEGVDDAAKQTIRMKVSGIKVPANQDVLLQLHVNCQKLAPDLPITDPSYVGSCTFFSHQHAGHGAEQTTSFYFSLNQAFGRLYADRPLSESEPLKVAVLVKPLFPAAGEVAEGLLQELTPKQISIEVVAPTEKVSIV